jgi:hypothetical protein
MQFEWRQLMKNKGAITVANLPCEIGTQCKVFQFIFHETVQDHEV